MSIFKNYKRNSAIDRLTEERLYEAVAYELDAGFIRKGLMTMAMSETEGNLQRANAKYIKLRVQSIIDENEVENYLREMSEKYSLDIPKENKNKENISDKKPNEDEFSFLGVITVIVLIAILIYVMAAI